MISWLQNLSYLIAGAFYYFFLASIVTAAAGITVWGVVLIALAVILAGFASGVSLLAPRTAAVLGGAITVVFLIYGTTLFLYEPSVATDVILVIPAILAVATSAGALRSARVSTWRRHSGNIARVALAVLAVTPILFASWILGYMAVKLTRMISHGA